MRASNWSVVALSICATAAARGASAVDLFVTPGGTGAACTQAAPCALGTALAAAAENDTIYLGAGTYTGTGQEVVLLDKTVNLLGGWSGAPSGPVVRDHVVWTTVLDGQDARRVVKVVGAAAAPTIDGLSITRGNATGLVAGCSPNADEVGCGGGILVADAGGTISNNNIAGNVAARAAEDGNEIAAGGGISVAYGHGTVIRDNTLSGNTASTASQGMGGGIAVEYCTDCVVEGNRVVGNTGTTMENNVGFGGGIAARDPKSYRVAIVGNYVRDNQSTSANGPAFGDALYTWYVTQSISGNLFASRSKGDTVYLGYATGSFTGNRVEGAAPAYRVLELVGSANGSELLIANNFLVGGSRQTVEAFSSGTPLPAVLKHNTVVGNGLTTGVLASGGATVTAIDNIVAGHAVGMATADSAALVADHTLFWRNDDDGIRGTSPVDGDPRFVNRAYGDFHVFPDSAAIGQGVDAGITKDIDGDARPGVGGFDIGADEVAPAWFDFGTPGSPVAPWYTQVTPVTVYSPALGYGWASGSIAARDRLQPDDMKRDLCFTPLGTFVVDVPNGRYRVTVTTGDQTTGHSQMGFFLEGQQVASVSTAAGEFKTVTTDVSVTDGQLTLQLDDLGGSDPNVVINGLIVLRMPSIWLDLGTAGSLVQGGWARITPTSLFTPAAGAGWMGGTVQARDRGVGSALLRDFNFTRMAYFGMFLQDGIYDLALTFGDATTAHDRMSVALQAQGAGPAFNTAANQFVTRTYPVSVVENMLRIFLVDGGGSDPNLVLGGVEIHPRSQPRFDFGTEASPVEEGYRQVTPATAYEAWRGYGWTAGALAGRDRGVGNALRRDFVFSKDAELAVDLLPGRYTVSITFGDATTRHDLMGVFLEGIQVDTVTTLAGASVTLSYPVLVSDGQLNVRFADQGGSDPNVVINGLTIE